MAELFADVIGQHQAVAALRAAARAPVHAYLLVGPPGSGKRAAARSFAASLLCPEGGCGRCRHCSLALSAAHPDLAIVERTGASIGVDEARDVARLAARTPLEAPRQVLILADFHLVDRAAPALLKAVEEPPERTVFVVLADRIVPELVTIASRCVIVELRPLSEEVLVAALEAEGADHGVAQVAARAAGGRLDRARLLVADAGLSARQEMWRTLPSRLDGTGATVARAVGEVLAAIEGVLEPLRAGQDAELHRLAEEAEARGERGVPARREVEERHRREQRRTRTDELRSGLAVLARAYGDQVGTTSGGVPGRGAGRRALAAAEAVAAIDEAGRALDRNPNETLLLQDLLLRLSGVGTESPG
ncbi:MAG TPA: ATP-binding protein [Acidimicrobiales bacterium]|nr:ATP-binding protein [Acidimicrobiales bacterium]